MIAKQTGWALNKFMLAKGTGERLDDLMTFQSQGISYEGFTIIIRFVQRTEVTFKIVTPAGKQFSITATLQDTVSKLKDKIKMKEGIDRSKYVLKSGWEELPDSMTVKTIIDDRKSVRIVFKTIKIKIRAQKGYTQMRFTMTATLDETIQKVKKRIQQMSPDLPAEVMDLLKDDRLLDEDKTVDDLKLTDNCNLRLVERDLSYLQESEDVSIEAPKKLNRLSQKNIR